MKKKLVTDDDMHIGNLIEEALVGGGVFGAASLFGNGGAASALENKARFDTA